MGAVWETKVGVYYLEQARAASAVARGQEEARDRERRARRAEDQRRAAAERAAADAEAAAEKQAAAAAEAERRRAAEVRRWDTSAAIWPDTARYTEDCVEGRPRD
jgi:hypothetical protein